ncbi:MAG: purine-nucleoside phosphorylase, partial [Oscillospiraceae bacterium]
KTWVGNVLSSDTFYQEELVCEQANKLWMQYGVMAAEMESASLLTLAKKYNARALAMMTVSDSIVAKEPEMTAQEREQSLKDMISIALETVCEFI